MSGYTILKILHAIRNFINQLRTFALITLSILIALSDLAVVLADFILLAETEEPEKSSQESTLWLLFLHLMGFYFGMLGLIYSSLTKSKWQTITSLAAIGVNVFNFLLRLIFEVVFLEYRPEIFSPD